MTEAVDQELGFVTLARAGRIVAPIADQHQHSYFEGGIFHILKMLAVSPISAKPAEALPDLPELKQITAAPVFTILVYGDCHWQLVYVL